MRTLGLFALAQGLLLFVTHPGVAGVADLQLSVQAARMNAGRCDCGFDLVFYVHFSSAFTEIPGEADRLLQAQSQSGAYSHRAYLILEDVSTVASTTTAQMNLPLSKDVNGNRVPDFYEPQQAVTAVTTGEYEVAWGSGVGQLEFRWSRAAGSRRGSCILTMEDPVLGTLGPFAHTFELVEFNGSLAYTHQPGGLSGSVAASNPLDPTEVLEGTLVFRRDPNDRFNRLVAEAGTLASPLLSLPFHSFSLLRSAQEPQTYRGELTHPELPDYRYRITLVDRNDSNQNSIPDLGDDPANLPPPRAPSLALSRTATQLLLSIRGDAGRVHHVQQAAKPDTTEWQTIHTYLSGDTPENVQLSVAGVSAQFWRVLAE